MAPGHDGPVPPCLAFVATDGAHLSRELAALHWLADHGLVLPAGSGVHPVLAPQAPGAERPHYFQAPPGCPADWPEVQVEPLAMVQALGRALARLHALPGGTAPGGAVLEVRGPEQLVHEADERVRQHRVDPLNFDRARQGLAPQQLVDQMAALLPLLAERAKRAARAERTGEPDRARAELPQAVPTHGGTRPGALWLHQGRLSALLGVAGLALADPYRDLACTSRWLATTLGPQALAPFFAAYGLHDPDPLRLEFHVLLDELR